METKKTFKCSFGKGCVDEKDNCSARLKNGMCPAGHPCKRKKSK